MKSTITNLPAKHRFLLENYSDPSFKRNKGYIKDMNEHELLLLGLLVNRSQHGYQLNEFIERDLAHLTNMKKGNAYATLGRLEKEGYINLEITQEGNRPLRKVYSITETGERKFFELLKTNLSSSERMIFAGDVGLMFIDHLPRAEAIEYLSNRLALIKAKLAEQHAGTAPHGHGIGVDLALQHVLHMQRAELQWLESALDQLRRTS